ncbi:MAG: hypothetical protein CMJ78_02420 [Planctomycetaceae bacterium]|nr:hypothetical protein [Planctomycetaceae bacterium]
MLELIPNGQTRRDVICRMGAGLGGLALGNLLHEQSALAANSMTNARGPHRAPRAKAVIQLFMHGGPSHVDLLDPKPMLSKYDGKTPPSEVVDDEKRTKHLVQTPFRFQQCGESGIPFSEVMPKISEHADEIAVIRSMHSVHRNHEQAIRMSQTGLTMSGRPTLGAWVTYGLGNENQNLPGYMVLPDPGGLPVDGIRNWSSGWLPPKFQGTQVRSSGSPILYLKPPKERSASVDAGRLDLLRILNKKHLESRPGEAELEARIANFELAARMQLSATDALDYSQETAATQELYGLNNKKTKSYGTRCLMARRLVERGVRFVQILMAGQPWDTHSDNVNRTRDCCAQTDGPVGALLTDLKQRGLLDSTLVFWGGEFGRTPGAELRVAGQPHGRDHHPYGFSVWMAGGGVKGGQAYGATDDFRYRSIEKRVSFAQLHATMLHLLGLDHESLTWHHNGRDERLTDVFEVEPIRELIG